MASIGEGAARGLESGFRLGQSFIDQRDREAERKRQQELQAVQLQEQRADRAFQQSRLLEQDARLGRQEQRHVMLDERQQGIDAEQALGQEFADLQAEGKGLLEQFGDFGKIPKDLGESYALRVKGTRTRLNEARAQRYAPLVEKERQNATQLWAKIQAGQVSMDELPDDQLVASLTALTRRDVSDFMPVMKGLQGPDADGGLSPVQQAGQDFMAAAQNGNDEQMISAANVLFKPELMIGVGGPGRDGSTIVSKRIVSLVPHPQDPSQFTPLLEVKVKREDGKVGTYRAPVTENRSSDPDDNIKTISIQDGLERVGQLTTLAQALNQRGIIEKLAKGINDAGEGPKNFLEAYYATGGQKPQPKKVDVGHFEDFGGFKRHYLPDGRVVDIPKTAAPRAPGDGPADPTAGKLRGIQSALARGDITDDEAKEARRNVALGQEKPEKPIPQPVVKQITESRDNARSITDLSTSFKNDFGSKGVLGLGGEAQLKAGGVLGMDKDAVDWWKNYRKQAELVERHAMFGASLTEGEKAAWASADISPNMSPKVIKKNLETRARLAQIVADNTRDDMISAGHSERRVQEIAGRTRDPGPLAGGPARPKSKAEFDKLPSGAEFIDPLGQLRRKP